MRSEKTFSGIEFRYLINICFVAGAHLDTHDVESVSPDVRDAVEADSFWCMSRLLDGIQDNYTFAQPGIQTKVNQLRELVQRIDGN